MTHPHDRDSWEARWARAIREHPDAVASRPPSARLTSEVADLPPGEALDAGAGHGSEAIWLALRGWRVTAVDFSTTALDLARARSARLGADVAQQLEWVQADLGTWSPEPGRFDLVACLYVHVAGSVVELIRRLAGGVRPGGTILLVGHRPVDPETGAATAAAGQVQVSVEDALAALGGPDWEVEVAAERRREAPGSGVDAVVKARRLR